MRNKHWHPLQRHARTRCQLSLTRTGPVVGSEQGVHADGDNSRNGDDPPAPRDLEVGSVEVLTEAIRWCGPPEITNMEHGRVIGSCSNAMSGFAIHVLCQDRVVNRIAPRISMDGKGRCQNSTRRVGGSALLNENCVLARVFSCGEINSM